MKRVPHYDDEGGEFHEEDVNLGDVHDELENISAELSSINVGIQAVVSTVGFLGGLIIVILLVHIIRHW